MTHPGEKHLTASVFIISDEKVPRALLLDHKKLGMWMPPGGHKELLENPYENMLREAMEETGIDLTPYMPKPEVWDGHTVRLPKPHHIIEAAIKPHKDEPAHFHIDLGYVARIPFRDVSLMEAGDHKDMRWFTLEEIKNIPLFDNVRESLAELLKVK